MVYFSKNVTFFNIYGVCKAKYFKKVTKSKINVADF